MFNMGNVQKEAPFKLGEMVYDLYTLKSSDHPDGAEAKVIGLPSKKATQLLANGSVDGASRPALTSGSSSPMGCKSGRSGRSALHSRWPTASPRR